MDELAEERPSGRSISAADIEDLVQDLQIQDTASAWGAGQQVDLGAKKWRPSAVSGDGESLLYICVDSQFPRFAIERFHLARDRGFSVVIGLPIASLYKDAVLEVVVEIDAELYVIDDFRPESRHVRRSYLAAIADIEVPVSVGTRKKILEKVWPVLGAGTNAEKGKRLEGLLAFLFSQIRDLRVVERNYRNETEEIDLVLQIDNFSSRAWQNPGVPFILVEAKNRVDKASQQMMSALITKLQGKRGSARIGIMVSPAGFTEDARLQELRFSTQEICVVMLDGAAVQGILAAEEPDEELEILVRRGLLR